MLFITTKAGEYLVAQVIWSWVEGADGKQKYILGGKVGVSCRDNIRQHMQKTQDYIMDMGKP